MLITAVICNSQNWKLPKSPTMSEDIKNSGTQRPVPLKPIIHYMLTKNKTKSNSGTPIPWDIAQQ